MRKLPGKILVVDDDPDILTTARVVLRQRFENVLTESNPSRIRNHLQQERPNVILLDMNFSSGATTGNEGLFWLREILKSNPEQPVIMITAYGDIKLAVEAMKEGAADFVVKPWDNERLETTVSSVFNLAQSRHELRELKTKQAEMSRLINTPEAEMIGESKAMREVLTKANKVAATDANVLLLGENGTGKELMARHIHASSPRKDQPFIKIDLGALSATLFESELFGHKKGAFTDAREDRIGRLALANGGTLFLDEIGNLTPPMQAKLLSVLQNREVTPVGGSTAVPLDIRVISATNVDILEAATTGAFREDLLYRINTVSLTLPPLRQRADDIPVLAEHFLNTYVTRYRKENKTLSAEAMKHLQQHNWPGNVRELQHAVERAVIMSEGRAIGKNDFLFQEKREKVREPSLNLDDMERRAILVAIQKHHGNMSKVARELGLGRTTLYRKMDKYGIEK